MFNLRTRAAKLRAARQQLRLIQQRERALRAGLAAEFRYVGNQLATDPTPAGLRVAMAGHRRRLNLIMTRHLTGTASLAAHNVADSLRKSEVLRTEKKFDTILQWIGRILGKIKARVAAKVVGISQVTEKRIRGIISDYHTGGDALLRYQGGEGKPVSIVEAIQAATGGMADYRADRIARTETHSVTIESTMESVKESTEADGMKTTKEWVATADDSTRQSHLDLDGVAVGMDDVFQAEGGPLAFPGDPNGPPEEVINCRCVLVYNVE